MDKERIKKDRVKFLRELDQYCWRHHNHGLSVFDILPDLEDLIEGEVKKIMGDASTILSHWAKDSDKLHLRIREQEAELEKLREEIKSDEETLEMMNGCIDVLSEYAKDLPDLQENVREILEMLQPRTQLDK